MWSTTSVTVTVSKIEMLTLRGFGAVVPFVLTRLWKWSILWARTREILRRCWQKVPQSGMPQGPESQITTQDTQLFGFLVPYFPHAASFFCHLKSSTGAETFFSQVSLDFLLWVLGCILWIIARETFMFAANQFAVIWKTDYPRSQNRDQNFLTIKPVMFNWNDRH